MPLNTFRSDNIKPVKFYRRTPPEFIRQHMVGNLHPDGKLFTNVKLWIHKPTVQFPDVGIFFGCHNGKGSVFSRLRDVNEIRALANFINACADEILPILPALEAQAEIIKRQLEATEMLSQQIGNQEEELDASQLSPDQLISLMQAIRQTSPIQATCTAPVKDTIVSIPTPTKVDSIPASTQKPCSNTDVVQATIDSFLENNPDVSEDDFPTEFEGNAKIPATTHVRKKKVTKPA